MGSVVSVWIVWGSAPVQMARRVHLDGVEVVVKLIGILLIVFGVIALAAGGFSYTKREKVLDLGPIQATADKQKTVPLSPIVGIAAVAGGIVLVVAGLLLCVMRRRRSIS